MKYLKPQQGKAYLLLGLLLAGTGLQLIAPQLMAAFIDGATGGVAMSRLIRLALLYLGLALLGYLVKLGETYVSEDVGWTATNQLRADLTSHCLHLDMAFHNAHPPGELIERVDGDVSQLAHFFAQLVIQVLGQGLLPAFIAGIVWLLALQKLYTIGWLRAFVIAVFIWIVTSIAGWFLPVL